MMPTAMHETARVMRARQSRFCPFIDHNSRFEILLEDYSCRLCPYDLRICDRQVNSNRCVFLIPVLHSLDGSYRPILEVTNAYSDA